MSDDEQALLNTILAHPEADLPRLVYADWLEENGRAERAEFIRVQVELHNWPCSAFMYSCHENGCSRCGCPDADRLKLVKRESDLFERYKCQWFGERWAILLLDGKEPGVVAGVSLDLSEAVVGRGFPAEVRGAMAWLLGGECFCGRGLLETIHCTACKGVGRTPGHLAGLVAKWPIEACVVVGKEPYDDGGLRFGWFDTVGDRGPMSDRLSNEVWSRLRGYTIYAGEPRLIKWYPTRDAALAALSAAILHLAKSTPVEAR